MREPRLERGPRAWEARILPLNYSRRGFPDSGAFQVIIWRILVYIQRLPELRLPDLGTEHWRTPGVVAQLFRAT